ncbi:MAG: AAA family ATPase [Lachnospiraceae bacterium]|nr:AAA family ATPase [Lachnospiraceae bacterium]
MGIYVNPGNSAFSEIADDDYVDKTALIGFINDTIGSKNKLTCVSRPRRFGKTYAAKMLGAYYDRSCDSHSLFDNRSVALTGNYSKHINNYNVICFDVTSFISDVKAVNGSLRDVPKNIQEALKRDLINQGFVYSEGDSLNDFMFSCVDQSEGKQFIFIIDEWDAVIREGKDDDLAQEAFLNLLRGWFKSVSFTPRVVAAAYITGILPIKKDGSQSAISDFREYSVLDPGEFSLYVGFTEDEVASLCRRSGNSFDSMKKWYDGYTFGDKKSVYNPYSVMHALKSGKYKSYWKKTSAAETLLTYINMDQDGLQDDIIRLMSGDSITIDPDSFQNDVETFNSKDDVMTLMVHLGYLTYEETSDALTGSDDNYTGRVRIPNEEIRSEFDKVLRRSDHEKLISLVRESDRLLEDTIAGNEEAVARAITKVRDSNYAPVFYNNEQSLRYVIKMAYISCVDQYLRIEELPSGKGLADVVFIPKASSSLPAMIVELKWNKTADGAIEQIKDRKYTGVLKDYFGNILLVGINYNERTGEHSCRIEKDSIGKNE